MPKKINLPIDEVIEMYQSGLTCRTISEKYLVSESTIERCLKKNGIELLNNNKRQQKQKQTFIKTNVTDIVFDYENGLSTLTISKKYSKSDETIRRILHDSGVVLRNTSESLIKYDLKYLDNILDKNNCIRVDNIPSLDGLNRHNYKLNIKCKKHDFVWESRISNILAGHSCPLCRNKSEGFVYNLLKKICDYDIIRQKNICSYKYGDIESEIFVDFYIKTDSETIVIEYNGEQHYKEVWKKGDDFNKQRFRDNFLKEYCNMNDIRLVIIDGRDWKEIYNPRFPNKQKKMEELLCEVLS